MSTVTPKSIVRDGSDWIRDRPSGDAGNRLRGGHFELVAAGRTGVSPVTAGSRSVSERAVTAVESWSGERQRQLAHLRAHARAHLTTTTPVTESVAGFGERAQARDVWR